MSERPAETDAIHGYYAASLDKDEFAAERRETIIDALSWWEGDEGRWGYDRARDVLDAFTAEAVSVALSEPSTYRVKEVPTWHGEQDTPRFATTVATSAATAALDPPSTPATTSATRTRLTEGIDPRHIGWCAGGRCGATPDGACKVCGYVGKVSRHGVVPHHRDRRNPVTRPTQATP